MSVDLVLVSRTLQTLLERTGKALCYDCKASHETITYAADSACAPTGLLPGFLAAADAVWREATGHGFGLVISIDERAVLGFRVDAVEHGPFSVVMLCVMEVLSRIDGREMILANDLATVWRGALARATPSPAASVAA